MTSYSAEMMLRIEQPNEYAASFFWRQRARTKDQYA
jgi:hypothetical protein